MRFVKGVPDTDNQVHAIVTGMLSDEPRKAIIKRLPQNKDLWEAFGYGLRITISSDKIVEYLDESLPASAVEEAARMYPPSLFPVTHGLLQEGYINAANRYAGEIETLKAENSKMRQVLEEAKHALNNGLPRSREREALHVINKVLKTT